MSRIRDKRPESGPRIQAPAARAEASDDSKTPHFCFHYLQKKYCISDCQKDEKAALADTLRKLSQLTWAQLRQANRKGSGYEKIARHSIRAPIPTHVTEDVNFIAFRFYANAPMVGYRLRETFHVCWLDHDFSLYDHG